MSLCGAFLEQVAQKNPDFSLFSCSGSIRIGNANTDIKATIILRDKGVDLFFPGELWLFR